MDQNLRAILFNNYVSNTDGKKLIAEKLYNRFKYTSNGTLLDVGAGNGEITKHLASLFRRTVAIEPNKKLAQDISKHKEDNITVYECTIQDFNDNDKFDIILLSYFLDTFEKGETNIILDKVFSLLKPKGLVIGVTFLQGCNWDIYLDILRAKGLRLKRSGGFARLWHKLQYSGLLLKIDDIFESKIFGSNMENLYFNLAFFAKDDLDSYYHNKQIFIEILKQLTTKEEDAQSLNVKEIIFEIQKT